MKSALFCHRGDDLNREGIGRWLASFSELKLIVVIEDPPRQFWKRLRAERKRSGVLGLIDVLAFRLWFRLFKAGAEQCWEESLLESLRDRFPEIPEDCRILSTRSPNSSEVESALREVRPDFAIARCKRLLTSRIFTIPRHGVFVMHPGICPDYRNAHGCFWAVASRDYDNVGATLLKIDEGVDTGPVLAYLKVEFDPRKETHLRIQNRVVFENLDQVSKLITSLAESPLTTLDTSGRPSRAWGQPRLSAHLRWWRKRSLPS